MRGRRGGYRFKSVGYQLHGLPSMDIDPWIDKICLCMKRMDGGGHKFEKQQKHSTKL